MASMFMRLAVLVAFADGFDIAITLWKDDHCYERVPSAPRIQFPSGSCRPAKDHPESLPFDQVLSCKFGAAGPVVVFTTYNTTDGSCGGAPVPNPKATSVQCGKCVEEPQTPGSYVRFACVQPPVPAPTPAPQPQAKNIVQLAEATPDLSTLVKALTAGGLTGTLSGKGPFTVFAPTNEAFAKIPAADLQKLLEDRTALDKVLEYHVLAADFNMRDLMSLKSAATLEGDNISLSESGAVIKVNNAEVIKADVEATNGIVHLIDTVLMPPQYSLV